MIRAVRMDVAELEITEGRLDEIMDLADIAAERVWPRFQLRPGRACLAIEGGNIARFLVAAGAVLDYDHACDLFGSYLPVERGETLFHAFPDVLVADR